MLEKDIWNESNSFAHIAIRQGIGMAVFVNGELLSGNSGNTGFLGHTTIIPGGLLCKCGQRGCLECYTGKRAIEENYAKQAKSKTITNLEVIFKLADQGDKKAIEIIQKSGRYLGIAAANVLKLFDVHHFSISGLPERGRHILIDECLKTAQGCINNMLVSEIHIGVSNIKESEYALGGCLYAIEEYFQKPNLKLSLNESRKK
jgi:predicted NBD/HSP70 family sugar kinase